MPNPFTYSGRIEKPEDFIGREAELRYIFDRLGPVAETGQPQSISVVGDRRIGKTSLLYYLAQVYRQRLSQPDAYLFAHLDLESAACQTVPGLLGAILQALLGQIDGKSKVARNLRDQRQAIAAGHQVTLVEFEEAIKDIARLPGARLWPVVCLDEFEFLAQYPDRFTEAFYNSWRSLISANQIIFVIASMRPLIDLAQDGGFTSPFFNVFDRILRLGDFTPAEAHKLLDRGRACDRPFSDEECRRILHMAGRHPWHLQVAGALVYDAKAGGQAVDWREVEQRYKLQVHPATSRPSNGGPAVLTVVRRVLLAVDRLLVQLGRLSKRLGAAQDEFTNRLWGAVILILALVLLGLFIFGVPWRDIVDFFWQRLSGGR